MSLVYYRLRSAPLLALASLAAVWFVVAIVVRSSFGLGTEEPTRTSAVFLLLESGAVVMGVGAAFLVSEDVDPPIVLLHSLPESYSTTALARFAAWVALAAAMLEVFVRVADPVVPATAADLRAAALPTLVLIAGCSFLAGSIAGSLAGGTGSLGAAAILYVVESAVPDFPVQLRDVPGSATWQTSRTASLALGMLGVVAAGMWLHRASARRPSRRVAGGEAR